MKPPSSSTAPTAPVNRMPKTTRRNINIFAHAYGLRQAEIMREKLLAMSPGEAVELITKLQTGVEKNGQMPQLHRDF